MQDRFKFRYLKDNKIYEVLNIDFDRLWIDISISEELACHCKLDYTKLMQCTGLKDKNGKLIYEGDVIKRANAMNQQYTIAWNDKGFWSASGHALSFCVETIMKDYEVIGNIYENPELLEDEQ